mmetsp:Transcript_25548/g.41944  ORF Transcript_25548/g.41944 Transcript_25548/m.41944 type:complete len:584 (-) Transcript_25548:149-1900(-)
MASPFSFHCMICFEEFDIDKRFPVVLPCGHTYICNECAGRLDKCMECRTPLVEFIPRKGPAAPNTVRGGRGGRNGANNQPPPPPIKKRLPLPKNVVLMSLIEATELAAENVQGQEHEPSLHESPMIAPSVMDFEDDEEEKIKTGTTLAISDCGTYAVAAKDGLEIFPSRPESLHSSGHEHSEEDVDTLVRFFHMDHKLDLYNSSDNTATASNAKGTDPDGERLDGGIADDKKTEDEPRKEAPPGRLSWGDRVQIVSTQNGWAKLARGYGYVRAGHQQLVKVGGSVDRSCKLEAMLRLLSSRRKELREEQKRIDNQFISLMNELQVSLMADEDLTVIAADTFHKNIENDPSAASIRIRDSANLQQPELQQQTEVRTSSTYDDHTPLKPRFMERPMTPPGDSSRGLFFCSGSDVLNAVLPLSSARAQPPALPGAARSPAIAQEFNYSHSADPRNSSDPPPHHSNLPPNPNYSSDNVENTPTRILTSASHPSPSALRAGARAWREMHGRPPADGIDFRTGMSGHSALLSSNAHPHDYLGQTGRFFAGMSNHTGLTMWKAPWKSPNRRPPVIPSAASADRTETNSVD